MLSTLCKVVLAIILMIALFVGTICSIPIFFRLLDRGILAFDRLIVLDRRFQAYPWSRRLAYGFLAIALVTTPIITYLAWYISWDTNDRPAVSVALDYKPLQIGKITDAKQRLLMRAAFQYRETLTPERFMDGRYGVIQNALIAAEDKRFWSHPGYDWKATTKEGVKNLFGWSHRGASTITQQFARGIYPRLQKMVANQGKQQLLINNSMTRLIAALKGPVWANKAARKPHEIKYAVTIERDLAQHLGSRRVAKEFILTAHANMIYLGNGVYGVSYAAQFYFDKDLVDLAPKEAAFIVSLIPGPDAYSDIASPSAMARAIARRDSVARRMAENGFITEGEYAAIKGQPLDLHIQPSAIKTEAPASINAAFRELYKLGYTDRQVYSGDYQVNLTTDLDLQRALTGAVQTGIDAFVAKHPRFDRPQAAAIVLKNDTGAIVAEFGGFTDERNAHRMYNRARIINPKALRQTGSTIKIADNFAAAAAGLTPDTLVRDTPFRIAMGVDPSTHRAVYKTVSNFDGKFKGAIPWWEASAQSRNSAYLHMMHDQVGRAPYAIALAASMKKQLGYAIDPGAAALVWWAHAMGVTSHMDPGIAAVIGSNGVSVVDMAEVIRTACTGIRTTPYTVARIIDRGGKEVYANEGSVRSFPASSEQMVVGQSVLRGNIRLPHATGQSLIDTAKFPIQLMGKTGTSNDYRDAWFCGCTYGRRGYAIAIWVGYDDFSKSLPDKTGTGGGVAAPIAKVFFSQVYGEGKPLGIPPAMPDPIEDAIDVYKAKAYPETIK